MKSKRRSKGKKLYKQDTYSAWHSWGCWMEKVFCGNWVSGVGELESVDRERERGRERETSKQSTTPLRPATNNKMAYQPNGSSRLQCRSPQASTDHYDGTHGPFRSSMCFIKKCIYAMYCLDSCVPSKCEPV